MTTIGWLGTGRMGVVMATRLINDGAALTVWNRTPSKAEPLMKLGAAQADRIGDLGRCEIVFTTVTSSEDLIEVTLGSQGLFNAQTPPGIVVDCSTVAAEAATEVRLEATRRDIGFLSAPLSGNPDMVAGDLLRR
jgi:3-hydroxyisobutyrate dehydrogenase-like beta-hydroxyacid dehydrogenase